MIGSDVKIDDRQLKKKLKRLRSKLSEDTILDLIGTRALRWIDTNFKREGRGSPEFPTNKPWKPLKPSTIRARRQGSSEILQDTGRLKQSYNKRLRTGLVQVGTPVKYADKHEFGTRHIPARPMLPTKDIGRRLAMDTAEKLIDQVTRAD